MAGRLGERPLQLLLQRRIDYCMTVFAMNNQLPRGKSRMTDYRIQRDDDAATHSEEAAFPALAAVDLKRTATSVDEPYKNFIVLNVNNHCLRLAVMEGEFR